MHAVGIVAEYNPLHGGHALHMAVTRTMAGDDAPILCVMSGNFVQRGDVAVADQWARAEMALRAGADLVLELPLPWVLSSAEGFARGAVAVLEAAGVCGVLSFGSETGDLRPLRAIADCLDKAEEYPAFLKEQLGSGVSFAAARHQAVERILGAEAAAPLGNPNDILAIEYLRALRARGSRMEPLAVARRGAGHDAPAREGECPSASALRAALLRDARPPAGWMPDGACPVWERECADGHAPAAIRQGERALLALLRRVERSDFEALPDSGEGLSNRLYRAARAATGWEELIALAKTKRYAAARIRRLFLRAALALPADTMDELPYIRVLGSTARGRVLLAGMRKTARVPVLTKPAHIRRLGPEAQRLFACEVRATDLFDLCCPAGPPGGREWRMSPVTLP